ncbi:MAG: precorrin-3B C(17)-methyltransferase [Gemmiger sp.]|nr:precorrin-3B C(17)-methyltransferase [Gemmiger sp.]
MNKVFVVGLGPGGAEFMTAQARAALQQADVLCGYTVYLALVQPLYPGKACYATPMTQELDRCRWALERAKAGGTVALVCSGDAGVYGMAGPLLQLAALYPTVAVEVVPGVTAALSGGAVLGAPLGHDFCVISLSDLLTSWAVIEKRLRSAAAGDFAICLYNPSSHKRQGYLRRACEILLAAGKSPATCCGWVKNIGRDGQSEATCTLAELAALENGVVDMFTTVFIGSATTQVVGGRLVTPRGYKKEASCTL